MTATFDDEVVDTEEVDDDNDPTTVPSAVVAELVTLECLFGTDVAALFPALRLPPVDGFKPNIQTRCCKKIKKNNCLMLSSYLGLLANTITNNKKSNSHGILIADTLNV